jgi:parallel beta-helix repeat protein
LRLIAFSLSILMLFFAALLPLRMFIVNAEGNVVRVPSDFSTIQQAINAVQDGSTILVSDGVYYEHLTVNKTLTLIGASKERTIIDGSDSYFGGYAFEDAIVTLGADDVFMSGFTIRNCSVFTMGILMNYSKGSTVAGNVVTLAGTAGIGLQTCENCTVSNNLISFISSGPPPDFATGYGMYISSSANNTVTDNSVTQCYVDGISLGQSDNNTVSNNLIQGNPHGLSIHHSNNNTIFNNNFIDNIKPIDIVGPDVSVNAWSKDGWGNYWEDYDGLDNGAGGRVAGDGVGDTGLPAHDVDYFPLINPASTFGVVLNNTVYPISLVSNSTFYARAGAQFGLIESSRYFTFQVIGPANTTGYFNLTIPKTLFTGPWQVRLDGDTIVQPVIYENATHTTIYLNYSNNPGYYVFIDGTVVLPEYRATIALLIVMFLLLTPMILLATRRRKKAHSKSV